MLHFTQKQINALEHLHKINLINSCSGYKSANLIGTKSAQGITNVAVFSSVTHLGSDPALLGFFLRPTTVIRNTYNNIKATKFFTINHIHEAIIEDAHHTSAKYKYNVSEFDVTNLQETYKNNFWAPFVNGSPIQMAMEYVEEYPIKANGTILLVGEIKDLYLEDTLLETDGFVNLSKANIAAINGLDGYALPKLKTRLGYQRPKKMEETLQKK